MGNPLFPKLQVDFFFPILKIEILAPSLQKTCGSHTFQAPLIGPTPEITADRAAFTSQHQPCLPFFSPGGPSGFPNTQSSGPSSHPLPGTNVLLKGLHVHYFYLFVNIALFSPWGQWNLSPYSKLENKGFILMKGNEYTSEQVQKKKKARSKRWGRK